jgi:hypothetical protein
MAGFNIQVNGIGPGIATPQTVPLRTEGHRFNSSLSDRPAAGGNKDLRGLIVFCFEGFRLRERHILYVDGGILHISASSLNNFQGPYEENITYSGTRAYSMRVQ